MISKYGGRCSQWLLTRLLPRKQWSNQGTTTINGWSERGKTTSLPTVSLSLKQRSSLPPSPFASDLSLSLRVFFFCICIRHLVLGSLILFLLAYSLHRFWYSVFVSPLRIDFALIWFVLFQKFSTPNRFGQWKWWSTGRLRLARCAISFGVFVYIVFLDLCILLLKCEFWFDFSLNFGEFRLEIIAMSCACV